MPYARFGYVPERDQDTVSKVDLMTRTVIRSVTFPPVGKSPVTNAWTPDGRYAFITNSGDTFASVFDAKTYREIKRLEIGAGGANIGFSWDGNSAFISVAPANVVAVVDLSR